MNTGKTKKRNWEDTIIALLLLVMVFLFGHAYSHGDTTLADEKMRTILAYFVISISIISYLLCFSFKRIELTAFIIPPIIYFLISSFNVAVGVASGVTLFIRTFLIFIVKPSIRSKVLKWYRYLLIAMSILSLTALLAYYFGFNNLYRIVPFYESEGEYLDFAFSFIYRRGNTLRLCGLFNEPGYFGTICAFILCYEKMNLKKVGNLVLLFAGILTFSLAFIIIVLAYLIIISVRKPSTIILMIAAIVVWFVVIPRIDFENDNVNHIIERLTFSNGGLLGDNRSNIYVDTELKKMIEQNPVWGFGGGYSSDAFYNVSTYKTFLIDYGCLGFSLMYGSLLLIVIAKYRFNLYSLGFIVCFFLSVYQRPHIFNILFALVLLGSLDSLAGYRKKTNPISSRKNAKNAYAFY